jgi:AraC family transcriptional regulator, arabinose operon regulatory protein
MSTVTSGSYKNIWHGKGRQRIEIPKSILKTYVLPNKLASPFFIGSLGYYPQAAGHYTNRKKGLPENLLIYCVDGNGWFRIRNKNYKVQPNEFFILPRNTEHAYGSDDNNPWSIYWLHFGGTQLPDLNKLPAVTTAFAPTPIRGREEIIAAFNKIYHALSMGYSINNLLFANLCVPHFLSLFIYNSQHFYESPALQSNVIDLAIKYMTQHVDKIISLPELSASYNYSTSRFSSLFKDRTGFAPIDYFLHMKVQKATQLLDFTEKSVKEIAAELGFDDPYYFSRLFKKIMALSPTDFRNHRRITMKAN